MSRRCALVIGLLLLNSALAYGQDAKLPKVVLIGDSIRLGYAPGVAKLLEGDAPLGCGVGERAHRGVALGVRGADRRAGGSTLLHAPSLPDMIPASPREVR